MSKVFSFFKNIFKAVKETFIDFRDGFKRIIKSYPTMPKGGKQVMWFLLVFFLGALASTTAFFIQNWYYMGFHSWLQADKTLAAVFVVSGIWHIFLLLAYQILAPDYDYEQDSNGKRVYTNSEKNKRIGRINSGFLRGGVILIPLGMILFLFAH